MECHTEKKPGRIIAKMNSLVDEEIISALYDASNKGVKIDLIVRGICCLKPGIKGVSENIKVISFVGRLLEHSRIFYAENSGNEEIYIGSADMMPRNLDRRVEILVPITNPILKSQVKKILLTYLSDNTKARLLNSDGSYSKLFPKSNSNRINSQESFFISELKDSQTSSTRKVKSLVSRRID
jgi:polyphosphate kinase